MTGVSVTGVEKVDALLDKVAKGIVSSKEKPVYVGTSLFYGRFQERGTRRGVRPQRFLERAAQSVKSAARRVIAAKLEAGDVLAGLVELAQKAKTLASGKAPKERGKLRRSMKVQVGGTLRRSAG